MQNAHCQRPRGHTLPELLIVIAISALLLGGSVSGFTALNQRYQSDRLSNHIVTAIQFARYSAVISGMVMTLCGSGDQQLCDGDWSTGMLIFSDQNGNGVREPEEPVRHVLTEIPGAGTLTWRSFRNKPYLQFLPNGMTWFQNGNFTFCPENNDSYLARQWILNQAGRLRVASDNNADGIVEDSSGRNIRCPLR